MQKTPLKISYSEQIWTWFKQYGSFLVLFISSSVLICWPLLDAIFSNLLKPISFLGIAIGCFTLITIDFYHLLKKLHLNFNHFSPENLVKVDHFLSVSEAVRKMLSKWGSLPVREAKILASTTEIILPTIADCRHKIDKCEVIIQDFNVSNPSEKELILEKKASGFIAGWFGLIERGLCKDISIYRLHFIPNYYMIIFDQSAIVFGLLSPSSTAMHAVEFDEPIFIDGDTESGKKLILKFCQQYDNLRTLAWKVKNQ